METIMAEPSIDKEPPKIRPHYQFQPGNNMNPSGRPKGTNNKLSIKSLLGQLNETIGKPFEQQLAENYREAIVAEDRKLIHAYDNLFLSKLLADKVDLTVDNNTEALDAKREAFMGALAAYGQAVTLDASLNHPIGHNSSTVAVHNVLTVGHNGNQDSDQAHQDRARDDE